MSAALPPGTAIFPEIAPRASAKTGISRPCFRSRRSASEGWASRATPTIAMFDRVAAGASSASIPAKASASCSLLAKKNRIARLPRINFPPASLPSPSAGYSKSVASSTEQTQGSATPMRSGACGVPRRLSRKARFIRGRPMLGTFTDVG